MKPRVRLKEPNIPCIAWMCQGQKDGEYHVTFAGTWWDACKRWHETSPKDVFDADIPF